MYQIYRIHQTQLRCSIESAILVF